MSDLHFTRISPVFLQLYSRAGSQIASDGKERTDESYWQVTPVDSHRYEDAKEDTKEPEGEKKWKSWNVKFSKQ